MLMADSAFLWTFPKDIPNLLATKVTVTIHSIQLGADKTSAMVVVSSDALALYVVLTTKAAGRFKENAFALRPHLKKVRPKYAGVFEISNLYDTHRVQTNC